MKGSWIESERDRTDMAASVVDACVTEGAGDRLRAGVADLVVNP